MKSETSPGTAIEIPEFLNGEGEMAQLIREFDWSQTSLGPVNTWPKSLRTCVQIMLTSRQPIWLGWGKDLIKLYNDPYRTIVMGKHPWALGKPASVVWNDIWMDIEPMLDKVMNRNEGTYVEEQLLIMHRSGYPEETYYTFSYTPVAGDDGATEGMICFNTDDTERIISERQLKTLTQLGKNLEDIKTESDVYTRTIETLSKNAFDFTFASVYSSAPDGFRLVGSTSLGGSETHLPKRISLHDQDELGRVCRQVLEERKYEIIDGLRTKVGQMPAGAWSLAPDQAIVLPLAQRGQKESFGVLVCGVNPYRLLNENYRGLFELVADQISTSLTNVFALEQERKRIEALAEIDRAKTTFFSNISHEFRTPLTLLLGPVQDLLNENTLPAEAKEKAEVAYRNGLRMQRLVNTLLDFSRIEARRMEPELQAVDIVSFTEDLASNFRSAIEKAGMQLYIQKQLPQIFVAIDPDMWEKVILNLLSNAFKYSKQGSITVSISKSDNSAIVSVADTGIGIATDELEKVFERFYRSQNTGGRSQEGTGIGLAMVRELVKLQHGHITVDSELGRGSKFIIEIPVLQKGEQLKSNEQISPTAQVETYVQEASQWMGERDHLFSHASTVSENEKKFTVLLADDNADMRLYAQRLLSQDYHVLLAADGEEAYGLALEKKPDLILSDIMMPRLDGFGLLQRLKSTLVASTIPVIFLSARAGEEARVEGIQAGADDYLTKPFSSKELLARVANHIAISKARRKTEEEFFNLFYQAPAHIHVMRGPEHIFEFFHPYGRPFVNGRDLTGLKVREALPEVEGQGYFEMLDDVYKNGREVRLPESRALLNNEKGEPVEYFFNIVYLPWRDLNGHIQGVLQFSFDVTETVRQRMKAELNEQRLRSIAQQAPVAMAVLKGPTHIVEVANDKVLELWGKTYDQVINKPVLEVFPEIIQQGFRDLLHEVYTTGKPFVGHEVPVTFGGDGHTRKIYVNLLYEALRDQNDQIEGIVAVGTDVTEQVKNRLVIEEAESKLKQSIELADLGTWHIDLQTNHVEYSSRVAEWWGLDPKGATLDEIFSAIHPDDRDHVKTAVAHAIEDTGMYEAAYRLTNKITKEQRFIQASGRLYHDQERVPVRLSGICRDVTLEKTMQEELEKLVEVRTRQLMEVNTDLMRSNENLKQFAYVASHDLQEPLRKIQTYSDMVNVRNQHSEIVGREYLEKIGLGAKRMSGLIKDLLEFSQAERKDELFERLDLNDVLRNIRQDYEMIIQEKKALFEVGDLCTIEAIPLQMNQLFYNLVGNALKFSKTDTPPRIQIFAGTASENLVRKYNLNPSVAYCTITVSDNGIGFEQKFADQIFVLFQRLHVREKYEGTGIGLALCKKIVENHKGIMEVESSVGVGSTFRIVIPTKHK